MLHPEAQRCVERSDHLVNDGSRDSNTDLRAIREAIVALVYQLAEVGDEIREAAGRG